MAMAAAAQHPIEAQLQDQGEDGLGRPGGWRGFPRLALLAVEQIVNNSELLSHSQAMEEISSEDIFSAAVELAVERSTRTNNASLQRSRATQISYVLTDDDGITIQRIPLGKVLERAKLNKKHAQKSPPSTKEVRPRESFTERHNRDSFELATFHVRANRLIPSTKAPSQTKSHPAPGISSDYILKDESGEFLASVSLWDIAGSRRIRAQQNKIRNAISSDTPEKIIDILKKTPGGKITFHGGFFTGEALATEWNTIIPLSPPFEEIEMEQIEYAQLLDSRSKKDILGAIGTSALASAALGLLTGGLGLIGAGAGLLAGGNSNQTLLKIVLKDGRQALVLTPADIYEKIAACSVPTDSSEQIPQATPATEE